MTTPARSKTTKPTSKYRVLSSAVVVTIGKSAKQAHRGNIVPLDPTADGTKQLLALKAIAPAEDTDAQPTTVKESAEAAGGSDPVQSVQPVTPDQTAEPVDTENK